MYLAGTGPMTARGQKTRYLRGPDDATRCHKGQLYAGTGAQSHDHQDLRVHQPDPARGDSPPTAVPAQIGLTYATRPDGIDVGGATAPISQCVLSGQFVLRSAA